MATAYVSTDRSIVTNDQLAVTADNAISCIPFHLGVDCCSIGTEYCWMLAFCRRQELAVAITQPIGA
jgi:hypothetical protein